MERWDPICSRPPGLVLPSHLVRTGLNGPTRGQARSARWERVASGWYAPADRPECVEQRILDAACRLKDNGAVTAWAALRWRGAAFFDGLDPAGKDALPVPLILKGSLASVEGQTHSKIQLAPSEREVIDGLPVATVQRALFDEVVRRGELWAGCQAVCMAAAARLISVNLFARYVLRRAAWEGVPLVRKVVGLSRDDLLSPPEVRMHMTWDLLAELPRALANRPVFDRDGNVLGTPDLFDPISGTVGEYDGAHHKGIEQHRVDVAREERFRDHGLEYFTVVQGDSRSTVAARMHRTRARAKFLPPESCAWTLDPPPWYQMPESLDAYFERMGMVEALTHS